MISLYMDLVDFMYKYEYYQLVELLPNLFVKLLRLQSRDLGFWISLQNQEHKGRQNQNMGFYKLLLHAKIIFVCLGKQLFLNI